ncbi:endonuclease/exonuclease/phosphatase family protein [Flavobacterium sp. HXWNR69]|uniref:Endonuclease/exonuclease/phosphatase family protein n=1 Tax=Flavobacterium fragile TaxID=2949085 RepID=A0ABT0TGF2_9FLAO|nr:endonuclease/exonuclease/phosphatase family protein [Flavobacterium sp. HXWNR69]MCL9770060.1 endonuclease/exonuclease/phosphatase family protein [Flavobacterium sp. HXWNR69]
MKNCSKIILASFLFIICFQVKAQTYEFMTYNIRLDVASDGDNSWANRKEFLISQIQFYEPDVMGIQEARPNQEVDIINSLKQYDKVGIAREGIGKGESSAIFFKKEKFDVLETNTFWLSNTPDTISKGWDAAYNRICTYALFKDKKRKTNFWVFNTHLDHIGEEARTNGIQLIIRKIKELNSKNYPVIFMGDFNLNPTDKRIIDIKKVMHDSRDISEQVAFGPVGTFNNFNYNEPVTELIDYIFISRSSNIRVKKYGILIDSRNLKYPSDHFPILVEIKFEQ